MHTSNQSNAARATRRQLLSAGLVAPSLLLLGSACGPNRVTAESEGAGSLRVVWWGNQVRTERTNEVLRIFAASHDGLDVVGEPGDWGGYWDKLATQVAAGTPPDVVQMDEKYLLEYVERGALMNLDELGLDTTAFDAGAAEVGEVDGVLFAVNAGTTAPVVMANPALFDQAGMDLPDDTTWTWEEMVELGGELSSKLPEGSFGVTDFSGRDAAFRVWVRQSGAETFDGSAPGFDASVAADFFTLSKKAMDSGATPTAELSVEDVSAPVDQRLFATGRTGLAIYSSNQVAAFDAALGDGVELLRLPSLSGSAAEAQLAHQASMYWVVMSDSADPERSRDLVDFMVNDPEAGRIAGAERGVPANTSVRESITDDLSSSDRKCVDYLAATASEQGPPPPLTPRGASNFEDVLIRWGQDVLSDRSTPAQAGEAFVKEVSEGL